MVYRISMGYGNLRYATAVKEPCFVRWIDSGVKSFYYIVSDWVLKWGYFTRMAVYRVVYRVRIEKFGIGRENNLHEEKRKISI